MTLDLPTTPAWTDEWLAGLLEGEGTFGIARNTTTHDNTYEYPRVIVKMADRDVIERAAVLMGSVAIYTRLSDNPDHSTQYITKVHGDKALDVMKRVRPYMGTRRGARIDELLSRTQWGRV